MNKKVFWKIKAITIMLFFPCLVLAQGHGLYEFIGKNGKYGFMDKTGNVIVPAKYIFIRYPGFSEELAFVSEEKTTNGDFIWICIDTLGREKFTLGKKCYPEESFSEGYAVIYNWFHDKYWFIDKNGKIIFNRKFIDACEFTNGFARVQKNNKLGNDYYFIDKEGIYARHLPLNCSMFDNGIAYCRGRLIDTLGNVLIDNIHEWTGASGEYLKIRRNDQWGFIDRKGNIIIDFQYEQDRRREFDKFKNLNTDSWDALPKAMYRNVGFFHEGLASIQKDSLFGFINLKNEIAIDPVFKQVQYFSEGLAGATLDGKIWGFINKDGEFVIEPQYFFVDAFENGICGVLLTDPLFYLNDYYFNAIINKNDEILFRAEMHSYRGFQGELIKYYEGGDFRGRIYYLDKNGKSVIPKE